MDLNLKGKNALVCGSSRGIGKEIAKHSQDKSQKLFLYCRSGGRAGHALKTLTKLGYTNVTNLGGLMDAKKQLKK